MPAKLPPFWTLVEKHASELIRFAHRLVGDDAEDVVQDAYLRALRSYPGLEHGDHLRAWLFRITTTAAFDHHGRTSKEVAVADPEVRVESSADAADDGFFDLIGSLSEPSRRAMTLRFVDDLQYEDIGRRLGCSPAAARQRVSTGVRELRRRLS
jgi:RNA polymerase sigma-70 factor (ECF subfamily)